MDIPNGRCISGHSKRSLHFRVFKSVYMYGHFKRSLFFRTFQTVFMFMDIPSVLFIFMAILNGHYVYGHSNRSSYLRTFQTVFMFPSGPYIFHPGMPMGLLHLQTFQAYISVHSKRYLCIWVMYSKCSLYFRTFQTVCMFMDIPNGPHISGHSKRSSYFRTFQTSINAKTVWKDRSECPEI